MTQSIPSGKPHSTLLQSVGRPPQPVLRDRSKHPRRDTKHTFEPQPPLQTTRRRHRPSPRPSSTFLSRVRPSKLALHLAPPSQPRSCASPTHEDLLDRSQLIDYVQPHPSHPIDRSPPRPEDMMQLVGRTQQKVVRGVPLPRIPCQRRTCAQIAASPSCRLPYICEGPDVGETHIEALSCEGMDRVGGVPYEDGAFTQIGVRVRETEGEGCD